MPFSKGILRCLMGMGLILCLLAPDHAVFGQVMLGADQGFAYHPKTSVEPLRPEYLGDVVNLYNGSVEFYYEDINIRGNSGIPVMFARSIRIGAGGGYAGEWHVELPYIGGVFSTSLGWQVSTPGRPNDRCSIDTENYMEATPPIAHGRTAPGAALPAEFPFSSAEYWYGNSLHVPGRSDQEMMVLTSENNSLNFDPKYKWITSGNWVFSCLPSTANGAPGEGFMARSPDGMSYKFDWLAEVASYDASSKQLQKYTSVSGAGWLSILDRAQYRLLPTEVSDIEGNWVKYTYDPSHQDRLVSIASNDGRVISISYDNLGRVASASSEGRVWSYRYSNTTSPAPTEVVLPDQSSWKYSFPRIVEVSYGLAPITCADAPQPGHGTWNASVVAPSGLRGDFYFNTVNLGTSYVPRICDMDDGGYGHLRRYKNEATVALVKRELSGPGVPETLTWNYDYGPLNSSYLNFPGAGECVSAGCPETRIVTISKPNGEWERKVFGNRHEVNEGMLLAEDVGQGSTLMRHTAYSYSSGGQAFPVVYGRIPCYRCSKLQEKFMPLQSRVIEQSGRAFKYEVIQFDSLARPVKVEKTSFNLP